MNINYNLVEPINFILDFKSLPTPFYVILPEICISILRHDHTIGVGRETFPHIRWWATQKLCVFDGWGEHDFFYQH